MVCDSPQPKSSGPSLRDLVGYDERCPARADKCDCPRRAALGQLGHCEGRAVLVAVDALLQNLTSSMFHCTRSGRERLSERRPRNASSSRRRLSNVGVNRER